MPLSISESKEEFPNQLNSFLQAKGYSPQQREFESWNEIGQFKDVPYIAVRVGTERPIVFLFEHNQRVESQLMRQFAAQAAGGDQHWDWRALRTDEQLKQEGELLQKAVTNLREMLK